jgi:hypothetical protein
MEPAPTGKSSVSAVAEAGRSPLPVDAKGAGAELDGPDEAAPSAFLADLDDPELVISEGYIGPERRATGLRARLLRATFGQRRSLLRLDLLVVAAVVVLVVAALLVAGATGHNGAAAGRNTALPSAAAQPRPVGPASSAARDTPTSTTPVTTAPAVTDPPPTTTVPAPAATAAPAPTPATAPAAVAPAAPVPTAPPAPADAAQTPAAQTPAQLGAEALTLVRYPWQSIPGYSIQFLPISEAPSPSFYGNTTFTWGQAGGVSRLYVYPGETVLQLAGITAFEIGHEIDAAAVDPQGGEAQIEAILNIHPASWAPNCDCAEQDFLSGWYAAAFSDHWSPGVGNWSRIAPEPTGAVLAAVEPWLNPTLP